MNLSVFVQTEAEAQRAELLKVYSPDKNIYWNIHNPVVFSGNSKSYAGYSILKPAEGKKIEQGEYRVLYTDASGEEAETSFTVYYRDEMLPYIQGKQDFDVCFDKLVNVLELYIDE